MGCRASRPTSASPEATQESQEDLRVCVATDESEEDEPAERRTKILLAAGRQGGVHSLKLEDKLELASALAGGASHADRSARGGRFQPSVSDPNVNLLAFTHNDALPAMASEGAGGYEAGPERSSCGTRTGRGASSGGPTWEFSMRRGSTGGAAYGLDAPVVSQAASRRVRRSSMDEAAALIAITKNFSTRGALMDPGRSPYAHRPAGGAAAAAAAASGSGLAASSSLHSSSRGSGGYRAGPFFSHEGSEPQSAPQGGRSVRRASVGASSNMAQRYSSSGGCEEDGERGPSRGAASALEATSGRRRGRTSSPGQPTVLEEQEAQDAGSRPDSPTTRGLLELQQRHLLHTQQQQLYKQQHSPGAAGRRSLFLASPPPAGVASPQREQSQPPLSPGATRAQAQQPQCATAGGSSEDGAPCARQGGGDGEGEEEEVSVLLPVREQGPASWQAPALASPPGQAGGAQRVIRAPPEPLLLLRGISDGVLHAEGGDGRASAGAREVAGSSKGEAPDGLRLLTAPHLATSSLPNSPRDRDLSAGIRPRGGGREAGFEPEVLLSPKGDTGASLGSHGLGSGSTAVGGAETGAAGELESPLPGMPLRV